MNKVNANPTARNVNQDPVLGLLLFGGRYPGNTAGQGIANATRLTRFAEKVGWQEAWVAEHHFNPNLDSSSALTLAAYLLGATNDIRVGTAASVLSVWHPIAIAEQANMLSHASGGRFSLGVARGMPTLDWRILGDGEDRAQPPIFGEALDVLLSALPGRTIESTQGYFHFPAVTPTPAPAENTGPVFVAANSEPTVRIAAARRVPLLLPPFMPTSVKQTLLEVYQDEADRQGFDPAGVPHYNAAIAHIARDRETALKELTDTWAEWFAMVSRDTPALMPVPETNPAELAGMLGYQPLGSTDEVVDHLRTELDTLALNRTLLIIDGTGDPIQAEHNASEIARAMRVHSHGE